MHVGSAHAASCQACSGVVWYGMGCDGGPLHCPMHAPLPVFCCGSPLHAPPGPHTQRRHACSPCQGVIHRRRVHGCCCTRVCRAMMIIITIKHDPSPMIIITIKPSPPAGAGRASTTSTHQPHVGLWIKPLRSILGCGDLPELRNLAPRLRVRPLCVYVCACRFLCRHKDQPMHRPHKDGQPSQPASGSLQVGVGVQCFVTVAARSATRSSPPATSQTHTPCLVVQKLQEAVLEAL